VSLALQVLEHFSLRTALETMLDPENDFLRHAPQELKAMFRGLVIDIVLATDMYALFQISLSSFNHNSANKAVITHSII
jgi:hypothetical protein